MMQRALRPSALVPRGFDVESAVCDGAATVITVRPTSDTSLCPGCGASSGRIHSRYQRRLTDLPLAGRPVRLVVVARRFRCVTVMCGRRIFTERFDDGALAPWARRTARLDLVVHHLGLALGGCPAASFARTSGGSKARVSALCCAERYRHRRLGLAAQSAVRNNHLRPRAAPHPKPWRVTSLFGPTVTSLSGVYITNSHNLHYGIYS
jgi:transposase